MERRTTPHKAKYWAARGRPPPLLHDPKSEEECTEADPFCAPFGHVVKSRVACYFPLVKNDLKRLKPCCTREVFYPFFCEETYYCMEDLREAAVAKHGLAEAKRAIEQREQQREQQRKRKRRRKEGTEGGPEAAGVHLL